MTALTLVLFLFFQVPVTPNVIIGLTDGQKLVLENAEFIGFIEGPLTDAVLMYRQENFHGQLPLNAVSRIEFREYQNGKPFALTVTLKNGQKLEVVSERRDFLSLKGTTGFGRVTINHPDPLSSPLRLTTKKPNRKNDLTIQYLEFPSS